MRFVPNWPCYSTHSQLLLDALVQSLQDSLSVLSVELIPTHEKLVTLRRQLVALAAKGGTHQKVALKPLQEELRKIDLLSIRYSVYPLFLTMVFTFRNRVDGKFLVNGIVPASQAICSSLLEECFDICEEIKAHEDSKHVPSSLKPIHDRLSEIRAELDNLNLTRRWSLRETDLWNYSLSLQVRFSTHMCFQLHFFQEIDKMRVDGKFLDAEGNRPEGQYAS